MSKEIDYFVNINGIDVNASYSESTVTSIFMPLLKRLTDIQKEQNRRIIVFIAAPPGAGKSTLSSFLQMLSERNEELTDICNYGINSIYSSIKLLPIQKQHEIIDINQKLLSFVSDELLRKNLKHFHYDIEQILQQWNALLS